MDLRGTADGVSKILVSEACHDVIVHQPGCLHESVTDGGADEAKAAAL